MRTFLLNLPWEANGRLGVRAGSRWPFTSLPEKDGKIHYIPFPFFLGYAASFLKKNSKETKLLDCIAQNLDEEGLLKAILEFNPGLIFIETSTPSFNNDLRITARIKQEFSGVKIALGGPHAGFFAGQILKEYSFVDYILRGEYEHSLLDLVNSLEGSLDLEQAAGLTYREDGTIKASEKMATINDLDSLPWPEREEPVIYNYNDGFCGLPLPNVQIWSSRGCPFECTFCLWPQTMYQGSRYRLRQPTKVLDEMAYLIDKYHFKAVYFDDDIFNADKNHVLGICSEMKKRSIKIPWAAMARADLMDQSLLEAMKDSGLYAIKYGIESANQRVLDLCKKRMDLPIASRMIEVTKALGIKVHLTFCLGLTGETRGTINQTLDFIRNQRPDSFQVSWATPLPGTEYYQSLESQGLLLSKDWSFYDGNYKYIIKNPDINALDIEEIKDAFNNNRNF
ncbi:MAG: radical SAM protein [Candidatus Omnitrophota bacterium]